MATSRIIQQVALITLTITLASTAIADPQTSSVDWDDAALFAGGAATAFLIHESGHVVANWTMGNSPKLYPVKFLGFIPFFTISPEVSCYHGQCFHADGSRFGPGPRGLYFILSAGMNLQHISNDLLLSTEPHLRYQKAPFRKGMFTFNILTSFGYSFANWLALEPPAGDLGAMDELVHFPKGVVALTVFSAAALDLSRYYFPDNPWIPWLSRGPKGLLLGFTLSI